MKNKFKIISTVGPACRSYDNLLALTQAGTAVFRLNFSHGSHEDHAEVIENILRIKEKNNSDIQLLAELQGPKFRIGPMEHNRLAIVAGQVIHFVNEPCTGNLDKIYFSYDNFPEDANIGERVLVDDGKMIFEVLETDRKYKVKLQAKTSGTLSAHKGVHLPETALSLSSLTSKDFQDLHFILNYPFDWIACPIVRNIKDIEALHTFITKQHYNGKVIIKIENIESVKNVRTILENTDGIIWARADLCIEHKIDDVFYAEKVAINMCHENKKAFFLSTQIMDSMISNIKPTSSEVYGLAHAITDEVSGIILSGETAVGEHPEQAVKILNDIITNISDKPGNRTFSKYFRIDEEFRVLLIQYFNFFNEFVKNTKRHTLILNLEEYEEGIVLKFRLDDVHDYHLALDYFKEYLDFLSGKQNFRQIDFEKERSQKEKDLFVLSLKNEVQQLQFKLELKELKISYLNEHIERIKNSLLGTSEKWPNEEPGKAHHLIPAAREGDLEICNALKELRVRIVNNEVLSALNYFNDLCNHTCRMQLNHSNHLLKRYKEIKRLENLGLIAFTDRLLKENQITSSLLSVISELEEEHCH